MGGASRFMAQAQGGQMKDINGKRFKVGDVVIANGGGQDFTFQVGKNNKGLFARMFHPTRIDEVELHYYASVSFVKCLIVGNVKRGWHKEDR
jgi:hypothetical protein